MKPCGKCDICLKQKETELTNEDFESMRLVILQNLEKTSLTINALVKSLPYKEPKILKVIRFMLDNEQIVENEQMKLSIKN